MENIEFMFVGEMRMLQIECMFSFPRWKKADELKVKQPRNLSVERKKAFDLVDCLGGSIFIY